MSLAPLPGAPARDPALDQRLRDALAARRGAYEIRTHHRDADGAPRYVNRLIEEDSPYLLQHAHNPVDWRPWGEEAFAEARAAGRPVLLSVGYSTCHWCHVMEAESFEDEAIARVLNERYVPIKVDRETRPDVDHVYMQAVQALSGRGGWPMTVWLTPDRRPFFGGTYFPPRTGHRGMATGFLEVLTQIAEVFAREGDTITQRADAVVDAVRRSERRPAAAPIPGPEHIGAAFASIAQELDPRWGGFGPPPRFPMPPTLALGLLAHHVTGDPAPLAAVTLTLSRMAEGGVYDQLAGGFHRYSTDERWLVPHFEKMLYDQALLVPVYLAAYRITGDGLYARIARETLTYVARELTAPSGAFYAATDADSEGEEGRFFLWTPQEVEAAVGPEDARAFNAWYGVRPGGNWEGRSILNHMRPLDEAARSVSLAPEEVLRRAEAARGRLYEVRAGRIPPHRDDKEIVAWTALMARAFVDGARTLEEPSWLAVAARAMEAVLEAPPPLRRLRGGREPGFLEDVVHAAAACLDLFEATGDGRWLAQARALHGELDPGFRAEDGAFGATSAAHEALLVRERPFFDGVMPSGNAAAADLLLRLAAWTDEPARVDDALGVLGVASRYLMEAPQAVPAMGLALARVHAGPRHVLLVTSDEDDGAALAAILRSRWLPLSSVGTFSEASCRALAGDVPVLRDKVAQGGRATAYVCTGGACQLPTADPAELDRQLQAAAGLGAGPSAPR